MTLLVVIMLGVVVALSVALVIEKLKSEEAAEVRFLCNPVLRFSGKSCGFSELCVNNV